MSLQSLKKMLGVSTIAMAMVVSMMPAVASAEPPTSKIEAKKGEKRGKKGKKARRGERSGPMHAVKTYYKVNQRLADAYLLSGDYGKAVTHFEAIINYTPDLEKLKAEHMKANPERARKLEEKHARRAERGKKGKRGKRGVKGHGPAGKLHQLKVKAYLGAAAASHRMGDAKGAEAFASSGLAYADGNSLERATDMFERFLANPEEGAKRVIPSVETLEERIEEAKRALP